MMIRTKIQEVYRTPGGLRAVVYQAETGTWMMYIYNKDGTVKVGGGYATRKGAMIALSRGGGKHWAWLGIEERKDVG